MRFAGIAVDPPPGSFLQPSLEGERALAVLVFDAVGAAASVADLYAGCGSFTFPLAQKASVHAVEGEPLALQALKAAAERSGARVSAECRDLNQRPLLADELKRYQAVVFDPPRAGAGAQAAQLAAAGPALVVAVSCNPATLARDARTLASGGYRLKVATRSTNSLVGPSGGGGGVRAPVDPDRTVPVHSPFRQPSNRQLPS